MIRLIVAGSRTFNDYDLLKTKLDFYLKNKNLTEVEIVSGTAKGADKLGELYAKANQIQLKLMPADWALGKSAGYKRNEQMAKYASHCVVFWDGESRGTKHMIDLAKQYNLNLKIVLV